MACGMAGTQDSRIETGTEDRRTETGKQKLAYRNSPFRPEGAVSACGVYA